MLTVALDIHAAARLIAARGLWQQPGTFGADTENGPVDPVAALWLVAHKHLPYLFTCVAPGYADAATAMVLDDERVAAAVRHLSASLTDLDTATREDDPVERIADWVRTATVDEVIGRLTRLSSATLGAIRTTGTLPAAA